MISLISAKRNKVCIYPNISRKLIGSNNPYIDHLKEALDKNDFEVDPHTSDNAFLDLLRNGIFSDIVLLNWIENLPSRRMGLLQTAIILTYLQLLKICRVKIIWIKHNKVSHTRKWFAFSKGIQRFLARCADHIIIHGRDAGIADSRKIFFLPHPSNIGPDDILPPVQEATPSIDLLIWGSLLPYKGVLEFLRYAKTDPLLARLRIHIAGRAAPDYWNQLQTHAGGNTTLVNAYIEEKDLEQLFKKSRFILFTYNKQSVISSGVLVDSLVACKRIIAPDCGAFRDMAEQQQFVSLFDNFSEIAPLYRANYNNFHLNYQEVREFVAQNSWYSMGTKIKELSGLKTGIRPSNQIEIPEMP